MDISFTRRKFLFTTALGAVSGAQLAWSADEKLIGLLWARSKSGLLFAPKSSPRGVIKPSLTEPSPS